MIIKTKTEALEIFRTQAALGRALGLSRGAIWNWPEEFNQGQSDRVTGAAVRLGLIVPRRRKSA